jgi:hypothetical protein
MKRLVKCTICGKYVGLYKSYKVRIDEPVYLPGYAKSVAQTDSYVGQACRDCIELAGYKTGKKRKKKSPEQVALDIIIEKKERKLCL